MKTAWTDYHNRNKQFRIKDDLPELWSRIIDAIVDGPGAWKSPAEVSGAIGRDIEETTDELASMDVAGLIDVWERPTGPVVTLSVASADRFGLRLVDVGLAEGARWIGRGDPEPSLPRARRVCRSAAAADFDFLASSDPSPDEEASRFDRHTITRAEAMARACDRGAGGDREDRPRPTLLIGTGLTPWPGPGVDVLAHCPACGSRILPASAYCLCCDRWGLDDPSQPALSSTPSPSRHQRPIRSTRPDLDDPDRDRRQAEADRQLRKQRRREQMARRMERERKRRKDWKSRP